MSNKIVFYWHPMSSATPVACALAELDVPHERVKVDIRAGEQHRPDFLALNPNGKVPTLTVDGAPMFEALAIAMWLGERYGPTGAYWAMSSAFMLQGLLSTVLFVKLFGARVSRDPGGQQTVKGAPPRSETAGGRGH